MMRFTILAAGSRGDIQPYLAPRVGLQAAAIGRVIQSEDGVARAIALIERTLASHG